MRKTSDYGETRLEMQDGYESGIMTDLAYFYELVLQIKRRNRKYLSNYYLNEAIWAAAVSRGEVTYEYKKDRYLNLWWRKKHFRRLYYFIAEPCGYKVDEDSMISVCDVICRENSLEDSCRMLSEAGMNRYAVYEKWTCKDVAFSEAYGRDDLQVIVEDNGELFIDKLYLHFDELSDLLPDEKEVDQFIREKHFIGIHTTCDDMLIGGLVYTKHGSAITEEFLFVTAGCRGLGISRLLLNTLYRKYAEEKVRYAAWIRVDNQKSACIHSAYNFKKQGQFKVTFLKEKRI